jgi:DASH complex subunit DAM1
VDLASRAKRPAGTFNINKPLSQTSTSSRKAPEHWQSRMSSSTTPQAGSSTKRSGSGSRRPLSRPTTPLRPSSRSSLRESGKTSIGGATDAPLEAFEPAFAELSDSMADLEANFMHLQLMHESLSRFSENFASFLYGLNMNAFCVDFPEVSSTGHVGPSCVNLNCQAPISDSFRRAREQEEQLGESWIPRDHTHR